MPPIIIGIALFATTSLFFTKYMNTTTKVNIKQESDNSVTVTSDSEVGDSPIDETEVVPSPSNVNSNNSNWQYPGSIEIDSENYESSDDAGAITNWYQDKMNSMNVKSFVKTNSNGQILNKLEAANSDSKISIEISKESSSSTTKIKVKI